MALRYSSIPRSFTYVHTVQSLVTALAIYCTAKVFPAGSLTFILVIVAACIQVLFNLYGCTWGAKRGIHNAFAIPTFMVVLAGLWAAPLYYFSTILEAAMELHNTQPPGIDRERLGEKLKWNAIGLACSALNCILPLLMLAIFLVTSFRRPAAYAHQLFPVRGPGAVVTSPYRAGWADAKPNPTTRVVNGNPRCDDRCNRIELLRRLVQLQTADGYWDWCEEVAGLVRDWSGKHMPGDRYSVTSMTRACAKDLYLSISAARRQGRERTTLSAAELTTFRGMNRDLTWARTSINRAGTWISAVR